MLKIMPNFITDDVIDKLVSSIDMSQAKDFPGQQNIKTVYGLSYPPIHKEAHWYGKIVSMEFLTYEKGSRMYPHFDKYSFEGNFNWIRTGILFMNNPEEYEGGELVFNKLNTTLKSPKGTFVLFPAGSDTEQYTHSVNLVTSGKRQSLILRFTATEG